MVMSNHPACQPISDTEFNVLRVKIEQLERKFMAKLHIVLQMPFTREVNISGPQRETRSEAVKDGIELGRRYVVEGEAGAKSLVFKLKKKRWTPQERADADETLLSQFVLPGRQGNQTFEPVQEKLQPIGEGWIRHNDDMFFHPQGQVYFAQSGEQAGQYLDRSSGSAKWQEVQPPHTSKEHPISVRMASASCLKQGAKLERAVLLSDITRIARLACKIPLSFVDRPACALAIFEGIRNAEAAQWCAENSHKKLLPKLAEKIHLHSDAELEEALRCTLTELDTELLSSTFAYSGCCSLIVLTLGDRLVAAGVGQVRVTVLGDDGNVQQLLDGGGNSMPDAELSRVREAGGAVDGGKVCANAADGVDDVTRILSSRHVFEVLALDSEDAVDEKQIRSSYRRLALKVHPDKQQQQDAASSGSYKVAFAKLEGAKDALERMLAEDMQSCHELFRVLRSEVHTRAGAAQLLGVGKVASTDTEALAADAEKACTAQLKTFERMKGVAPDYDRAMRTCKEAVETLRRPCTPEALPRHEALLREPVSTSRAMGLRDLRRPRPVVAMEPVSATWPIAPARPCRVALLCGATAASADGHLVASTAQHKRRPKASALRWCLDVASEPSTSSSMAACIALGPSKAEPTGPPSKRARTVSSSASASDGSLRVRHILFRHQQLKQGDAMARREGAARSAQEAEEAALKALESVQQNPNQFPKLCRELSDCQTAAQAGALAGDFGWIGRGQFEPAIEDVVFALGVGEFSDVVSSSRGIHIFQRLG